MEQQIRFCTTSDSVRIAYATAGQGPPLVKAANWLNHLEFDWQSPVWGHLYRALAERYTLVRYDERGTGLSDRRVEDVSFQRWVDDLGAVIDALGLTRCALLGISQGGPVAIAYAVQNPQRVSHLILCGAFARWLHPAAVTEPMVALMRVGWGQDNPAFRQLFTSFFIPDASAEQMRWFNDLERLSASPEDAVKLYRELPRINVTGILPKVSVPTLVMHCRGDRAQPFEAGRELAALIREARFVPLESNNHLILENEPAREVFLAEIDAFLGMPKREAAVPAPASPTGLVTILFTDMEGSTSLTQRLGDARAHELVRTHNGIVREALKAHGGAEIKHTGDGIMASFGSASRGLECAIAIQRAFEALTPIPSPAGRERGEPKGRGEGDRLRVRIGLNAGEPVAEEADLFGTAVQLAARVCAQAEPGQILAANVVRELAAGKGFLFSDQGDVALRGFEDPVRLYEVRY